MYLDLDDADEKAAKKLEGAVGKSKLFADAWFSKLYHVLKY